MRIDVGGIELRHIREHPNEVKRAIGTKGLSAPIDKILALDRCRREILHELEGLRAKRRRRAKQIARMMGKGRKKKIGRQKVSLMINEPSS